METARLLATCATRLFGTRLLPCTCEQAVALYPVPDYADTYAGDHPGGLRRVRTGDAYQRPALGTYRRRREAWPQGPACLYVLGTRTSHGRTVRTAHRGTPGPGGELTRTGRARSLTLTLTHPYPAT